MVASLITVSFTDSKVTLAGWLAGNQIKASQGKRVPKAAAPPKLCLLLLVKLHTLPVYNMLRATPITHTRKDNTTRTAVFVLRGSSAISSHIHPAYQCFSSS